MKQLLLVCLFFIQPLSMSWAESDWFFLNIGIGGPEVTSNGNGTTSDIDLNLRAGLAINEYIDVGVDYFSFDDNIGTVEQDIETTFIFVKLKYPLSQDTKVYFMVGSTDMDIKTKLPEPVNGRTKFKNDDNGPGFGIGIQIHEDKNAAYTIDYISYLDEDDFDNSSSNIKMKSLNLGILWYF